ncbi:tripartite tricarboxylate transporter TctB family protein [Cytobacillus sp. FSL R5-0569]|uniref:tripartite tricarboxylate transporter TctB family protein n=1 Tax=unclassified Cytobacillus TaxID=2675268 RepID=UPI0030F4E1C6
MNEKTLNYMALIALIALGVIYYISSSSLAPPLTETDLGADYLPNILSGVLIVLCLINIFQVARKKENKQIKFASLKKVTTLILFICLYIFFWQVVGYFYIVTFLFLFLMFTYYQRSLKEKKKLIIKNLFISVLLVLFVYIIFDQMMKITF